LFIVTVPPEYPEYPVLGLYPVIPEVLGSNDVNVIVSDNPVIVIGLLIMDIVE